MVDAERDGMDVERERRAPHFRLQVVRDALVVYLYVHFGAKAKLRGVGGSVTNGNACHIPRD